MKKEDLKSTKWDHAHTIAKTVISGVPLAGGPAAEIFAAVVTPPLAKRRDQIIIEIINDLAELQGKIGDFDIAKLSKDEMFITTVTHATTIAIRNHQEEKLNSLRNAIMNSALVNHPEEDLQMMFLQFIDSFTISHLKILKFLYESKSEKSKEHILDNNRPYSSTKSYFFRLNDIIEFIIPELKGKQEIIDFIINDLERNNLIHYTNKTQFPDNEEVLIAFEINKDGTISPSVSDMGKQFLSFISKPDGY